jgi:hypothetical protein|tara:strand:+ start:21 stop:872 length:852 start_codon:yes stop_codon:yes gene_type:complete
MKEWVSPIPRKVHLIWIGNNDYPDYFKFFLKTFEKNFINFEIKVWGNKDLTRKNFPLTYSYIQEAKKVHGKQMFDADGNKMFNKDMKPLTYSKWAQITDLMRLEIVCRNGGYYFDTTFEILKPMYNLLNKPKSRFIGCNEVPRFKDYDILSNSFFGATPKNPILKRLLSEKRLSGIDFYNSSVDFETGPGYLRSGIKLTDNYRILPTKTLYPFVEEYSPGKDPSYRKSSKNKCHSKKKTKKTNKRLKSGKGHLRFPCDKYPGSYALKHWQLGKSWLVADYYIE